MEDSMQTQKPSKHSFLPLFLTFFGCFELLVPAIFLIYILPRLTKMYAVLKTPHNFLPAYLGLFLVIAVSVIQIYFSFLLQEPRIIASKKSKKYKKLSIISLITGIMLVPICVGFIIFQII